MNTNKRGRQVTRTPIKEEAKSTIEEAIVITKRKKSLNSDKELAEFLKISYPSSLSRFRDPQIGIGETEAKYVCEQLGLESSKILDYTFKDRMYAFKGNPNQLTSSGQSTCLEKTAFLLMGYLKPNKINTFSYLLNDHLACLVIQDFLNVTPKNRQASSSEELCIINGKIDHVHYNQAKLVLQEMKECFQQETLKFNLNPCKV